MEGLKHHSSKRFVVTEIEVQEPFIVERFFDYIYNEGPGTVLVGIDENTYTGENPIYLEAGEKIPTSNYNEGFPRACSTLFARVLADETTPENMRTATLRALGV